VPGTLDNMGAFLCYQTSNTISINATLFLVYFFIMSKYCLCFICTCMYCMNCFFVDNVVLRLPSVNTCACHVYFTINLLTYLLGWLGSRVVSVLDSGAEGPGFKSQSRCCRVTVLGKLFTPIVLLFTKRRNWSQPSEALRG